MSAILHVRCPVEGCSAVIDSVIETETWGSMIPGDHGCGNVTLHGSAMSEHLNTHPYPDQFRSIVAYQERTAEAYTKSAAAMRERFPDVFTDPS